MLFSTTIECHKPNPTKCKCVVLKTIPTPPPGGASANGSLFGGDGVLQGGGVCDGLQGQCAGENPASPNFT